MRPGTERIAALMEALGSPQRSYPSVHVAGTNGKFSLAVMITELLGELGLTVGTYTSPHLESTRERIAVASSPISEEDFAGVLSYLRPYVELVEGDRPDELTYFELLTAMAFESFFDRPVHAAVLEAGLGGEYDATNVADAKVAVITRVARDHVAEFGDDLLKAAWEKGGVIKKGASVVTGVTQPELLEVVEGRARERGAVDIAVLGREIFVEERVPGVGGQLLRLRGTEAIYSEVFLPLHGPHQAMNAALAVAAVERFAESALDLEAVQEALGRVRVPGRLEIASRKPLVVLDGGHNPDAAAAVVAAVVEAFAYGRVVCVLGMLADKLVEDTLRVIAALAERFVLTVPASSRAADTARMAEALEAAGVDRSDIEVRPAVAEAVRAAIDTAGEDDLVLVFGSLYTAGEARAWLRSEGLLAHP